MKAYHCLEEHFQRIDHLQQLSNIVSWDESVIMPAGSGNSRSRAIASLHGIIHEMTVDKRIAEWLSQAKQENLDDPWQQRNLALMEKHYKNATCIPAALITQKTQAALACEQAWRNLRAQNNWRDFQPLLQKSFNAIREINAIREQEFQKNGYDLLIDEYSPDINQAVIDPIFTTLKNALPSLIQKIIAKQPALQPLAGTFPIDQQKQLSVALMQTIGFDFNCGRLDVSHHPFCGGVSDDVRITTRYNEQEFISAAMAVCHETGHAMYEFGLPRQWLTQPVGKHYGMAVHESQSLLIEMQVCRSREFMTVMAQHANKIFGVREGLDENNLYHHYTHVKPSLIRVDADAVTYPLHVIMRYEIEKKLFNNEINISDLPAIWDEYMKTFFDLDTRNNFKDGVMQDVHWPCGAFGYFPAYTLGALIAAQLFDCAKKKNPKLLSLIQAGDFSELFHWLRPTIHNQGSLLTFDELIQQATGEALNPQYYLRHVEQLINTD
ncbi:MAG: carboxypeptidase M32 [Legionellales bacterium]|nr:carboxypeptidase M32 [Legionellales bacterium]